MRRDQSVSLCSDTLSTSGRRTYKEGAENSGYGYVEGPRNAGRERPLPYVLWAQYREEVIYKDAVRRAVRKDACGPDEGGRGHENKLFHRRTFPSDSCRPDAAVAAAVRQVWWLSTQRRALAPSSFRVEGLHHSVRR